MFNSWFEGKQQIKFNYVLKYFKAFKRFAAERN